MNERAIFIAASQMSDASQRDAYLDEACAGDDDLRRRVVALLDEQARLGSFLEHAAEPSGPTLESPVAELPGSVIGNYKLLEKIGEGGFGVVFMAEQTEPVRRKVALKVLKPGMDTRQVVARFEAERQALAIMDHPNIAKVFDGGATPPSQGGAWGGGRPYFVMELVKGTPITAYCDDNHLTPRQRLELFSTVCHAVQHAHQKGIIHRDLKPSNVLVSRHDSTPVVKVIDFGVAKALGQDLTEKTLFTGIAQMIGTPLYMSPEQAGMSDLDVDTRSDIYSLGVLLYELLTGTTPFDRQRFKTAAYDEIRRIIREEEPPRPSTRLSHLSSAHAPREEPGQVTRSVTATLAAVAAQRQTEPARLTKLVRGELDWIVMKALEKDRNRRYETANGLALDVQRYLADEPVQACPPSMGYRLRKFVRRNKGAVMAASLLLFTLVGGIVGTGWGLVRASVATKVALDAEKQAKHERTQAVQNLYDSLVREARALRLARRSGYRNQVWSRLRQALQLEVPNSDVNELRREAGACLGDFLGFEPVVVQGFYPSRITALAVDSQATLMAVGLSDGTLSLRSIPEEIEVARLRGHGDRAVRGVAFDSKGRRLVAGISDGTLKIWQLTAGRWVSEATLMVGSSTSPSMSRVSIAFTPDDKRLVTCCAGASAILIWDLAKFQLAGRLDARDVELGVMTLSADGKQLAAAYRRNGYHGLRVWDLAARQLKQDLSSQVAEVYSVAFSPNGKLLACGGDTGIAVFDTGTFRRHTFAQADNVHSLVFSQNSQVLMAGMQAGTTKLWNVIANHEIALLEQPHAEDIPSSEFRWVLFVAKGHDDRTLVSASRWSIAVWNLAGATERQILKTFAGGVPEIAFSPTGDLLACVSKDRSITLWDPTTGELVRSLHGAEGPLQDVAFSPDGRLLVTGDWSRDKSIRLWDVESGHALLAIDPQLGDVWSVAFSADGNYLAAGGELGWVLWKAPRYGEELARKQPEMQVIARQEGKVGSLRFTPDSSLLAWVAFDRTFHLWNVEAACARPAPFKKLGNYIRAIRTPINVDTVQGGKRLLLSGSEKTAIWDMATGQAWPLDLPPETSVLPGWGWCEALSPDGTRWAVGHPDGRLVLWRLPEVRAQLEAIGLGWNDAPRTTNTSRTASTSGAMRDILRRAN